MFTVIFTAKRTYEASFFASDTDEVQRFSFMSLYWALEIWDLDLSIERVHLIIDIINLYVLISI